MHSIVMHSIKFQCIYMNIAKAMAKENTACLSRKLAAIIVDGNHKIRGTGLNGVPHSVPHSDTRESLSNYFWPRLESDDVASLGLMYGTTDPETIKAKFLDQYTDSKICPRKILGCESGERPLLCNCTHAEQNCLINAACDVSGCVMYCATPIPCINCTSLIINARIKEVHCFDIPYHKESIWMFKQAAIELVLHAP